MQRTEHLGRRPENERFYNSSVLRLPDDESGARLAYGYIRKYNGCRDYLVFGRA